MPARPALAILDIEAALPAILQIESRTLKVESDTRPGRKLDIDSWVVGWRQEIVRSGIGRHQLHGIALNVLQRGYE